MSDQILEVNVFKVFELFMGLTVSEEPENSPRLRGVESVEAMAGV